MNTKASNRAFELSKKGDGFKSKLLLLIIGILNQSANWKRTNFLLRKMSSLFSNSGHLHIRIRRQNKVVKFTLRTNNNSDYQSLFECFSGMYKIPGSGIHHVLDGGANIGFFAINIFMQNKDLSEIICVEPNPLNIAFLTPNTKGIPATIVNAAMADFAGNATFNFKEHNTGHINGSPGHTYFHDQTVVNCVTITDLIPPEWEMKNTLVKLDIEGQEYNVFRNMFASNVFPKYIAAELHDYLNAGGKELIDRFNANGYKVFIEGTGGEGNVCRQIFAERKDVNS
jgi:FkbM family methyltransferase